jgi:N-acetylglucosaminyldiphosphoundecaprenol N-acetyl-beta-D-mannosaminyltransferase
MGMKLAQDTENNYRGYDLYGGELKDIPVVPKLIVNTINQYSFCIAEEDPKFKEALQQSHILLPDGVGIVVALKSITGKVIKKIAGTDIHFHLLDKLNKEGGSCFYLGSSDDTLEKIKLRIHTEYPNITCHYYSPPFAASFAEVQNQEMIAKINACKPDVLFVGMTAPKQEKWVHEHKGAIEARTICSIGAVFDFFAGTNKRASPFWINLGLEWFVRLAKEPRRMWKRYMYYGPVFLFILLQEKFKADLAESQYEHIDA